MNNKNKNKKNYFLYIKKGEEPEQKLELSTSVVSIGTHKDSKPPP